MHKLFLPSRNSQENDVIYYDKKTNFMLFYESLAQATTSPKQEITFKQSSKFKWKRIFDEGREFGMELGLRDSQVAVCKGVVLDYFRDNFDHHFERDHFLNDLLSSEISDDQISFAVYDKTVFHETPTNSGELLACAMRLLKNCSNQFSINKNRFRIRSKFRVLSSQCQVLSSHSDLESCFINDFTKIGEDTVIDHSVLQTNCVVGKGVALSKCYLGDGVQIPDHWRLSNCCVLKSDFVLEPEALAKIGISPKSNEMGGYDLKGIVIEGESNRNLPLDSFPELRDDESYDLDSESEEEIETGNLFEKEFFDVMQLLEDDGNNFDKVNKDLVNLRFSHNTNFNDCLYEILKHALFRLFEIKECGPEPPSSIFKIVSDPEVVRWSIADFSKAVKGLVRYKGVLQAFMIGPNEKSAVLEFCQTFSQNFEDRGLQFHTLAQMLYGMELVQEESFFLWEQNLRNKGDLTPFEKGILEKMEKFLIWLRESNEEESESESEDEDEETGDSDSEEEDADSEESEPESS